MRKKLISLLACLPLTGMACPTLEGKWTSSLEKFEAFNGQWANVESKPWSYMVQTQGKEIIEYNASGKMTVNTPELTLNISGRTLPRPASVEHISYQVLGCTADTLVLKYTRYDKEHITQLHFEQDNVYWEYMGSAESDGNSHIREYFIRVE